MRFRGTGPQRLFGLMLAVALALMSLAACTVYGEHAARSYNDATGGESLERVFWKDVAAGNWAQVERALASNYVAVTPTGTLDRAAALEQYRHWGVKDYSIGDLKTEMNGDTIVVTYTITFNGSGGSQLPPGPHTRMSVWQQQKAGWVIIAQNSISQNLSQP